MGTIYAQSYVPRMARPSNAIGATRGMTLHHLTFLAKGSFIAERALQAPFPRWARREGNEEEGYGLYPFPASAL